MKPNHFRIIVDEIIDGKSSTIASMTLFGVDDPSAEQYSDTGNALLKLARKLEPEKKIRVELLSLEDDGKKPFIVFQ